MGERFRTNRAEFQKKMLTRVTEVSLSVGEKLTCKEVESLVVRLTGVSEQGGLSFLPKATLSANRYLQALGAS